MKEIAKKIMDNEWFCPVKSRNSHPTNPTTKRHH